MMMHPSPKRAPRVVLVLPLFPQSSETFVVRHFLGLLSRGWDVFVLCDSSPAEAFRLFPELDRPEIRRRIRRKKPTRPRWRVVAGAFSALVGSLIRAPKRTLSRLFNKPSTGLFARWRELYLDSDLLWLAPDLVHFEFGTLARGQSSERLGCPMVVSFRGYDLNFVGLDDPDYYRDVWREAAAIHVLGEDLRRRALRRGCPPELPCFVIPPAVDAERFRPPPTERGPGPLRLLSVGRLEWKKGYEDGMVALDLLRQRGIDFRWKLIGNGNQLEALAFARYQLGLEDRVELAGALPPEAVAAELQEADLFFHPAISEGFCNAVLEAQASGLPVVCSDADGLGENVEHGVTGLVVPRRSPEALAAAIGELAGDPARRKEMGRAGRERVGRLFPPEAEMAGFERLYRSILVTGNERCESTSSG